VPQPEWKTKFLAYFTLARPVNVLITMATIVVTAALCADLSQAGRILIACLSGAMITAAANAINDVFDIDIDGINRPQRPLPRRVLSVREARLFSFAGFILGVLLATGLGWTAFFIAFFCSITLYAYSAKLKGTALWGNGAVSLATAFAFLFGGVAIGHPRCALVPALFAFLLHLGREVIKDMEDVEGDRACGAATFPVRCGLIPSQWLVTLIFVILLIATWLPYITGIYGFWYLLIVALGVQSVLIFAIVSLWSRPERANLRRLSALLKADMVVGLAAIYAGRW
jgi:geranylgeranylglycerol-phosphate geranylgeranyltransferase